MYKTKTAIAVGTLLLLGVASTSYAADPATKQPMDQAVKSVDKNLAKDPDNKGLQNAAGQLQTNQERQDKKRAEQKAKRQDKKAGHKDDEHHDKADHHDMTDHHDKAERPERAERPEKPARPGR